MADYDARPRQTKRQRQTRSVVADEGKILGRLALLLEWMTFAALLAAIVAGVKLIA